MDLSSSLKKEKDALSNFFGKEINIFQPEISEKDFKKFSQLGFDLHFLPKTDFSQDKDFPGWKEKPSKNFYQLIKEEKLPYKSIQLFDQWIFIEKRKKPKKNFWWISKDDIWIKILKKIRIDFRKYCQKIDSQQYENDFILPILKELGFSSRFSLTWHEIDEIIRPKVAKLLGINQEKIRLPRFIEWNFLGNLFYQEWAKTETWEWFSDRLLTGECLTGGSNSLGICGWDPPHFWSTILGFRFLIEI